MYVYIGINQQLMYIILKNTTVERVQSSPFAYAMVYFTLFIRFNIEA